ncbi:VOC family protein [Streptomyces sp. NPDC047000]|uniref:VOC family protein n=1 Tax=Streptomyces sp. NPDC047000 TaxID=3155474 RepID=UPI0033F966D4
MTVRWTYAFVDRPAPRFPEAVAFWAAVTGTRPSGPRGERGEFTTLVPDGGADACLKVQALDRGEADGGSGGVHLDLAVEDVGAFTAVAVAAGAVCVAGHAGWAVLRSPGGQMFCAVPWHGETVRPPVVDGCRADQVCLGSGPSAYDAEVVFWTRLTGWASVAGSRPEFHVLQSPPRSPARILLQRFDDEGPAVAHLDLACADRTAARARHEELGASHVATGPRWTVMRDPAGGVYCLTDRDPQTGILPGVRSRPRLP